MLYYILVMTVIILDLENTRIKLSLRLRTTLFKLLNSVTLIRPPHCADNGEKKLSTVFTTNYKLFYQYWL